MHAMYLPSIHILLLFASFPIYAPSVLSPHTFRSASRLQSHTLSLTLLGPAVMDPQIDALIVSEETLKGAELINDERRVRGFKPLQVVCVSLVSNSPLLVLSL